MMSFRAESATSPYFRAAAPAQQPQFAFSKDSVTLSTAESVQIAQPASIQTGLYDAEHGEKTVFVLTEEKYSSP
jgi:hypothetical protein